MKTKSPKILFIGAITFEETSGSHPLFYRLFKEYPADQLMIIGSHKYRNSKFLMKRLPNVTYHIIESFGIFTFRFPGEKRLLFIRGLNFGIEVAQMVYYYFRIKKIVKTFKPDSILTLTMDFHWYLAHKVAKKLNIPLDLVLHDLWEPNTERRIRTYLARKFGTVFMSARNRFCISPTMERFYFKKWGIPSEVVYPIGKKEKISTKDEKKETKTLTVVFFGNIWNPQSQMIELARILDKKGMQLVLFSNRDLTFFSEKYDLRNVIFNSFIENEALLKWCKVNADILYLPMYFDKMETEMVQCSFPSKIVDYTSLGLPILIHAPKISSIVEFAECNKDLPFAEVVTTENIGELEQAVIALSNENHRKVLGNNSKKIWQKFFAPEVVRKSFFDKVSSQTKII